MNKIIRYDDDASAIGTLYAKSREGLLNAVRERVECGRRLVNKKNSLSHGEWIPWLEKNKVELGFGLATAKRLMSVAQNSSLTSHMTETDALKISKSMWGNVETNGKLPSVVPTRKRASAQEDEDQDFIDSISYDDEEDGVNDSDQVIWRRMLMKRAAVALDHAQYEDWSQMETDRELVRAVEQAAEAWRELAAYIKDL